MLWLLLCLLPPVSYGRIAHTARHNHEATGGTMMRPHIYFCRSPNMEDFTCWWHPLSNLTDGEEVTYILTYSKEKETKHECPDYITGGPNSCHFDSSHTSIWTVYCMTVTAVTAHRNYTSKQHCLDVAEIVQTETPVNLTYNLTDAGGDEMAHNALISWTYPVPAHVQYGWITLVYELQYRRVTEPDNWKVKHPLREPQVELLGLPVDDYMVRVRCRAQHSKLWSDWSSTLLMSIPPRSSASKLLVLILVTGVGVVALLVITFSIVLQSKRIKEYFLPPIPKPRIIGIDPLLLKGNLDEINRHFSNFHSYRPPSYSEEVWDQVSADDIYLTTPKDSSNLCNTTESERDTLIVPCNPTPSELLTAPNPTSYVQSVPPYCSMPSEAFAPSLNVPSPWPMPEIVSLPGTDYSMMEHPSLPNTIPARDLTFSTSHSPQDFYTCVQLLNESGEVHLVPCLPPPYCREFPPLPRASLDAAEKDKKKATNHQTRKNDGGNSEKSEAAVPLLPVAVDNSG
ncbi:prolactin receptor isoform X2 [Archocentrus centrarchus]|uniref:prolactin receptor isoform X2 n=1 Tax=Archocentrus centrarchus TaxID=63155 RepID=UPI0011E9C15A|nr:prolactin receptor-like isoform X2 [Archocentrus centrarchus]